MKRTPMNEESVLKVIRTPIQNQVDWKCNCPYCLDGCSQDIHNKKFIAEAIAIHSHIDWNKIPELREILVSRPPQNVVWLELVFLIKEVIENKLALTEIISHASIDLVKTEWSKIADYLEKRAKEYRRSAKKAKKDSEGEEATIWEGVAEDLEACAYVIDKGMHWNT